MYRAELYKLNKSGSYRLLIVLTAVVTLLLSIFKPYGSFEELLHHLGNVSYYFILYLSTRIAVSDRIMRTLSNMIASGMRRSTIYYSKMRVAISAAIVLSAIDIAVRIVTALFYHNFMIDIGVPVLVMNIIFHLLLAIMGAILYFAIGVFIGSPIWAIMISVLYMNTAPSILSLISKTLALPIDLGDFTLTRISTFTVQAGMPTSQIIAIVCTFVIVIIASILAQVLTSGREV